LQSVAEKPVKFTLVLVMLPCLIGWCV